MRRDATRDVAIEKLTIEMLIAFLFRVGSWESLGIAENRRALS